MTGPVTSAPLRDPLYLEADGQRWRVHDCIWRQRWVRLPLGSRQATKRIFVGADGVRRVVDITQDRDLREDALRRQLRGAAYLPTQPPHEPIRDPR